jgi:sugar phosphate permease
MKQSVKPASIPQLEEKAYSKVTRRLMPLLFLCFIVEYIARVNVGYARLQMQADLQLSDAIYGVAAGIFFIGYFLFEVPANILLQKIGAKYWLSTIMIFSGLFCAAIMFSYSAYSFYLLRFLLGIVESGFFPGVILYLTFWYPDRHRAKVTSMFMTGVPLSGVVGGLISGWIMTRMAGIGGFKGWQWLSLVEGLLAVVGGIAAMVVLSNGPRQSKWLNDGEKEMMVKNIADDLEKKAKAGRHAHRAVDAFKSPQVWLFCLVYFGLVMATYGVQFWLPQIIKDTIV